MKTSFAPKSIEELVEWSARIRKLACTTLGPAERGLCIYDAQLYVPYLSAAEQLVEDTRRQIETNVLFIFAGHAELTVYFQC